MRFTQRFFVVEKSIVDDEIIHLWNEIDESIVFAKKSQEFVGRSVDCDFPHLQLLVLNK